MRSAASSDDVDRPYGHGHNRRRTDQTTGGRDASAARPLRFLGPFHDAGGTMHMKGSLRIELFGALADRKVSLVSIEARGSSIVTTWRITGRNDRGIPPLGISPNGRTLDVEATTVDSLIDGIPRRFSMVDLSRVIDQIGDQPEARAVS
jgi:hypothetical protein